MQPVRCLNHPIVSDCFAKEELVPERAASRRLAAFLGMLSFKFSLDILYVIYVVPVFGYMGFQLNFNIAAYTLSSVTLVSYLALAWWILPDGIFGISFILLCCFALIPQWSLYGLATCSLSFFLATVLFWVMMFFGFWGISALEHKNRSTLSSTLPPSSISVSGSVTGRRAGQLGRSLSWVGLLCSVYLWAKYAHFEIITNLLNATTARLDMRTVVVSTVDGYLMKIVPLTIIPAGLVLCFLYRLYFTAILCVIASILQFSISGNKIDILVVGLVVLVMIIARPRSSGSATINSLVWILTALTISGIVVFSLFGNISLASLLLRAFWAPAQVVEGYFGFFSLPNNSPLHLSESILRMFIESPYPISSGYLIGSFISPSSDGNLMSNSGLFGDAYGNFGLLGLVLYPAIYSVCFAIFARVARSKDRRIALALLLPIINTCIAGSFFTWLISGGMVVSILLLWLIGQVDGKQRDTFSKGVVDTNENSVCLSWK